MKCTKEINIPKDFYDAPIGRLREDSEWSGQRFREEFLEPAFKDMKCDKIVIILDGAFGYGISFLKEAFGGLAKIYGSENVKGKLEFISKENPTLKDRINKFIDAERKGGINND